MNTFLEHTPTELKKVASTGGGEYKGPCPWCGGEDRFTASPAQGESGLWVCRQCERSGDGIDFMRAYHGLSFAQACERLGLGHKVQEEDRTRRAGAQRRRSSPKKKAKPTPKRGALHPPPARWQEAAGAFLAESQVALWSGTGAARDARNYLKGRGFTEGTIRAAGLGLNAKDRYPLRTSWGLDPKEGKPEGGTLWLPRGIVLPWEIEGVLWKVNIRRPGGDVEAGLSAEPWKGRKYQLVAGSTNALYGAGSLRADLPAVIVEGELDALAIRQAAGDLSGDPLVAAVATGSTGGARRTRWIGRLAMCPQVLVSFDADEAGEQAAQYWLRILPQARRWRPYWGDPAGMLEDGADVRAWVVAGLTETSASRKASSALLERPVIRWAWPPVTDDWLAWAPGASREHVPPGLVRADWNASFDAHHVDC